MVPTFPLVVLTYSTSCYFFLLPVFLNPFGLYASECMNSTSIEVCPFLFLFSPFVRVLAVWIVKFFARALCYLITDSKDFMVRGPLFWIYLLAWYSWNLNLTPCFGSKGLRFVFLTGHTSFPHTQSLEEAGRLIPVSPDECRWFSSSLCMTWSALWGP